MPHTACLSTRSYADNWEGERERGKGFLKRGKGERVKEKNYYQCPMPNA
jgi:hypothetical protein